MADRRRDDDFFWADDRIIPVEKKKYYPNKSDKEIIETFLEASTNGFSDKEALEETARECNLTTTRVAKAVKKQKLKEEAKKIRQEITEEIYKEKVPLMQDIVGLSLQKLKDWLQRLTPDDIQGPKDAQCLANIATSIENLNRLELGKSTVNVAIEAHATHTIEQTQNLLTEWSKKDKVFFGGLIGGHREPERSGVKALNPPCNSDEQSLGPDQPDPPKTAA